MGGRPVIAVTMGDPAGVGPEIVLKALNASEVWDVCRPVVIGDMGVLDTAKRSLPLSMHVKFMTVQSPEVDTSDSVGVIDMVNVPKVEHVMGEARVYAGRAVAGYIEKAVEFAMAGKVDAITTAPINKETLKMAGYGYPGHTEMLAALTKTKKYGMMLVGGGLRVILATIHCPLKDVAGLITSERVTETIRLAGVACRGLGVENPRIAVAGLNPHASDGGLFGGEEADIIAPACATAAQEGADVKGPIPPDTVFYRARKGEFDIVVCMYHDQGLIPLKMLAFDTGVNVTVGLPIIRTSVDHGTAYDIAGKGIADPSSLIEAIKLAALMAEKKKAQHG